MRNRRNMLKEIEPHTGPRPEKPWPPTAKAALTKRRNGKAYGGSLTAHRN